MTTRIIYEIPTSPRIKGFLAFERSCQKIMALRDQTPPWGLQSAVLALLDVDRIAAKVNLKRELIKEIKHQIEAMEKLSLLSPHVDHALLDNIVAQQKRLIASMAASGKEAENIFRDNELLNSQRKRTGLHSNSQDPDSPAYQHLMARSVEEQRAIVNSWMHAFRDMQQATDAVLGLIRSSVAATEELAYLGFFQSLFGRDKKCQLLRISLPAGSPYYPEISVGRSKFSIRFLEPTEHYEHAMQIEEDVAFKLTRCAL